MGTSTKGVHRRLLVAAVLLDIVFVILTWFLATYAVGWVHFVVLSTVTALRNAGVIDATKLANVGTSVSMASLDEYILGGKHTLFMWTAYVLMAFFTAKTVALAYLLLRRRLIAGGFWLGKERPGNAQRSVVLMTVLVVLSAVSALGVVPCAWLCSGATEAQVRLSYAELVAAGAVNTQALANVREGAALVPNHRIKVPDFLLLGTHRRLFIGFAFIFASMMAVNTIILCVSLGRLRTNAKNPIGSM